MTYHEGMFKWKDAPAPKAVDANGNKTKAQYAKEMGLTLKCPVIVYSRVVGFYAPVPNFNKGKRQEFRDRKVYTNAGGMVLPGAISTDVGMTDDSPRR